jgi:hypothetical protein
VRELGIGAFLSNKIVSVVPYLSNPPVYFWSMKLIEQIGNHIGIGLWNPKPLCRTKRKRQTTAAAFRSSASDGLCFPSPNQA